MKQQKDFIGHSRSPLRNQIKAIADSIGSPPKYNMHGLVRQNWFQWLWKNLKHLGNTRYPYQTYQNVKENNGVFCMDNNGPVSVGLLSDWASDTPESHNVAGLLGSGQPDYTIHLGDTYYVGNEKEIACNFNSSFGAPWPYGKRGSFALLGNHEMYSSGKEYFTHLLPYMSSSENGEVKQQEASFFSLENDYWRIIGLDTGYRSLKGFLGIRSNKDLYLHPEQVRWIKEVVQPEKDNKGIILLSHHQPYSAFEKEAFVQPGEQLCALLGGSSRNLLWFWGHEHRLALYGANQLNQEHRVFGRCIGHGGMPVEIAAEPSAGQLRNLVLYDCRERKRIDGKYPVGYNGYAVLTFAGPKLTIGYYDDNENNDLKQQRKVLEEVWTAEAGGPTGLSIRDFTQQAIKKLTAVQPLEKALHQAAENTAVPATPLPL